VTRSSDNLSNPIEFLKGVGPQRAELLQKELNIYTFGDLLEHFPYRHIDRTKIDWISELNPTKEFVQVGGTLSHFTITGGRGTKRLVAKLQDKTGSIELTWFQGLTWVEKLLESGRLYLAYGRLTYYNGEPQLVHPELELLTSPDQLTKNYLEPVYSTTEKLKARSLGGRQLAKLTRLLLDQLTERDLPENIPPAILNSLKLVSRYKAYQQIHFPSDLTEFDQALKRLKFEEFFIAQLRINLVKANRHRFSKGVVFDKVGENFNTFYDKHLPFQLTNAQKRVIREIRQDTAKGKQMNRLLQGDVGSGKTIVALLIMLLAADNGFQACLMAPTEILSRQHFNTISKLLEKMDVPVALLTGNTKTAERRKIAAQLENGTLKILIGTHAVIEDAVKFDKLGIVIIDEQHRFGVAQRARLWKKAEIPPHVLVMTATPIPRTLAMTAYGDLDYSIIDELPPGRQPITTVHRYESHRSKVMDFIRVEIDKGRQVYIIFPLIEESAKLDYENLMKGYENVKAYFPEPKYWISMVHGKQPVEQKNINMQRFIKHDTQIMVSTTVIEVGVDVPNASVMVIESAEKFGLSQLHQLRGRVGRGAEKSYCILLTGSSLGTDAKQRMKIMVETSNGFVIAEKDLQLRGPGEIEGTRQSGELNFKLASIVQDREILEVARNMTAALLEKDPDLVSPENLPLKNFLGKGKARITWAKIS
jgi:ATP-dependent DNA helicase RecG